MAHQITRPLARLVLPLMPSKARAHPRRMKATRPYRHRRRAPPLCADVIVVRAVGASFAGIGRSYGCRERTVHLALDRYADRGEVPPVAVHALHTHDTVARALLLDRIRAAYRRVVPVERWDAADETHRRFGVGSIGYML